MSHWQYVALAYGLSAAALIILTLALAIRARWLQARLNRLEARAAAYAAAPGGESAAAPPAARAEAAAAPRSAPRA